MSPEKKYLAWRRQPDVGCVFARLIASSPSKFEQLVIRVASRSTPARVASGIAKVVETAIANRNGSALTILLPGLTSLERTAKMMIALGQQPKWALTTSIVKAPPAESYVAFHLVREIVFGETVCPSEALVLGPFKAFPPTRKSPVVALELFIGEPRPYGPLDDAATTKANLAHIELGLPTHKMFQTMWKNSIKGRTRSLGGSDNRAKAKVTLVVPAMLARRLGCVP